MPYFQKRFCLRTILLYPALTGIVQHKQRAPTLTLVGLANKKAGVDLRDQLREMQESVPGDLSKKVTTQTFALFTTTIYSSHSYILQIYLLRYTYPIDFLSYLSKYIYNSYLTRNFCNILDIFLAFIVSLLILALTTAFNLFLTVAHQIPAMEPMYYTYELHVYFRLPTPLHLSVLAFRQSNVERKISLNAFI